MRCPIADAHLAETANDFRKRNRLARGRVEERMSFVGCGPLRTANKVLAPLLGRIGAAGHLHQAANEGLLFGLRRGHRTS